MACIAHKLVKIYPGSCFEECLIDGSEMAEIDGHTEIRCIVHTVHGINNAMLSL